MPGLLWDIAVENSGDMTLPREGSTASVHFIESAPLRDKKFSLFEKLGLPLKPFTTHALFLPYVALQQIELLRSSHTKAYFAATSNLVFVESTACPVDVFVDVDTAKIAIHDEFLASVLSLSSADKRFIASVVKNVRVASEPGAVEGSSPRALSGTVFWEGSDDWVREQFELYMATFLYTFARTLIFSDRDLGDGISRLRIAIFGMTLEL